MTAKQEVVWSLYASGHTVSEIARTLERSKGNVSTMLKKIRPVSYTHLTLPTK